LAQACLLKLFVRFSILARLDGAVFFVDITHFHMC